MKIAILGGGISGLSAAWELNKRVPHAEVVLLEKESRLGGWIETKQSGPFLFERGPRTFSSVRSPHLLSFIREMGLEEDLLFSSKSATRRFLYHKAKLQSAGSLLLKNCGRLFLEPFQKKVLEDETIDAFAKRRFGKKIAELFFDPITLGIYGGDYRKLSVEACFPSFKDLEKKYGSLVLGAFLQKREKKTFPGSLFTLRSGMESLISRIEQRVSAKLVLNSEILALRFHHARWEIKTSQDSFYADYVFSALGAAQLKALLPSMPTLSSASIHVVNLGFLHALPIKKGYGYLVPSKEGEDLLGMIWDSQVFPSKKEKLTAMVRGDVSNPQETALLALSRHLNIEKEPDSIESRLASHAIPQPRVGDLKKIIEWEKSLSQLRLLGNYLEGPSVEQCIVRSKKIIQQMFS